MMQVLLVPLWMDETMKNRYQKFMENKVLDAFWNAKKVLIIYGKKHRVGNASFEEVIFEEKLFVDHLQPLTKNRN
jgi:hypothetical protein